MDAGAMFPGLAPRKCTCILLCLFSLMCGCGETKNQLSGDTAPATGTNQDLERIRREAAIRRSRDATVNCWNIYRTILASHKASGFDRYEGLDLKLAEVDMVFVDEELRKHIHSHIDWIKGIRRCDGSPLDVAGNILQNGIGAFNDANNAGAKVASLKSQCQDIRAVLSNKYEVAFDQLSSYGPLPVLK